MCQKWETALTLRNSSVWALYNPRVDPITPTKSIYKFGGGNEMVENLRSHASACQELEEKGIEWHGVRDASQPPPKKAKQSVLTFGTTGAEFVAVFCLPLGFH